MSKVDFILSNDIFHYLIVTPHKCESTYVITINTFTGRPFYSGAPLIDIFPEHSFAVDEVLRRCKRKCKRYSGCGVIGIAKTSTDFVVGVIEKARKAGVIMGKHTVWCIEKVKHVSLYGKSETKFDSFQLNGNHLFCETFDLTQPTLMVNREKDLGWIWNSEWKKPFEQIGLGFCCVDMIQGYMNEFQYNGDKIIYILKRSVLNPGTRYLARGINENNDAGNEIECELIIEKDGKIMSNLWRRGSAPIIWSTKIPNAISTPVHEPGENFSKGTKDYFQKILSRFDDIAKIQCFSLLGSSEIEITKAYEKAISELDNNIQFINYDFNQRAKELSDVELYQDLKNKLLPLIVEFGFTSAKLSDSYQIEQKQKGLVRFNCADSLDRVNICTFFYSMFLLETLYGEKLPQEILDFLVLSFFESGNIVSLLYTNTPAIKFKYLKKYSDVISQIPSESTITVQRRFQNLMVDQGRNDTINMFLHPLTLSNRVVLDTNHIFLYNSQFPIDLFDPSTKNSLIIDSKKVQIILPVYLALSKISLNKCSASKLLIYSGRDNFEQELLVELFIPSTKSSSIFVIDEINKFGISKENKKTIRFLTLEFISEFQTFTCGNIYLEFDIFYEQIKIIKFPTNYDNDSIQRFIESFNEFLSSGRKLKDVLALENIRIGAHIPEEERIKLCLEHSINPSTCDPYVRLISGSENGKCSFCENENVPVNEYTQEFNGVLYELYYCTKCIDSAEMLQYINDLFKADYVSTVQPIPLKRLFKYPSDKRNRMQRITYLTTSVFTKFEQNSLLNNEVFHIDKTTEFELLFIRTVIITEILISATSNIKLIYDGKEILPKDGSYKFEVPPITQKLQFIIEGENLDLSNFQVFGVFVQSEQKVYEIGQKQIIKDINSYGYEWNENERTSIFKFDGIKSISKIGIETIKPEKNTISQSIIIQFLKNDEIIANIPLILPLVKSNVTLWYNIQMNGFNKIKMFYMDRVKTVHPHSVEFGFN